MWQAIENLFSSYTICDFATLKMENDIESKVHNIWDVCLETINKTQLVLKDRYAPKIWFNFILVVGQLDDER